MFHPWPSLATAAAAVGFALIFGIGLTDARLAAIFITVLLTQLAISALNDWADRDRDAIAGRWRPIAMERVAPQLAVAIAIACGIASLIGAALLGAFSAVLVLLGLVAGWLYDLWLKPTPFSFIPFAIAFPLLPTWVALLAGRPLRSLTPLLLAGALFAIAIHLADSLPDLASDAAGGLKTLAVQLGRERAIAAIVVCLMAGLVVVLAALRFQPVLALALFAAALIAVVAIAVMGGRRPGQARWMVSAFSLLAGLALMTHLPDG